MMRGSKLSNWRRMPWVGMPILLFSPFSLVLGDLAPPAGLRDTLALVSRTPTAILTVSSPETLSFVASSTVTVSYKIQPLSQTYSLSSELFVDGQSVLVSEPTELEVSHIAKGLAPGLHRIYVRLMGEPMAQASVQFYTAPDGTDLREYFSDWCRKDERFSLGINHPCDGLFQMGHEYRLLGQLDEAETMLMDVVHARKEQIAYPFIELSKIRHAKGDRRGAAGFRQIVERLYPGYQWTLDPEQSKDVQIQEDIVLDLAEVEKEELSQYAHLFCLWSGMIITKHAGISPNFQSAGAPGNHYKLLSLLARQFNNSLFVELGTLHAAATVALASSGNRVVSYNVHDDLGQNLRRCGIDISVFEDAVPGEMQFLIADATDVEGLELMLNSQLIFVDTNHHGDIEDMVYQYLSGSGWQGIMVLDDIFLNREMDAWWGSVTHPKFDLTDWGHTASGTGIIDFSGRLTFRNSQFIRLK